MKPYIITQLFIACINFKTDTCSPGTNNCLSNITEEIPKLQKFTEKHQQFKISLGETQINTHRRGRKSKPISLGTDLVGLIFTRELSRVDSAGVLRKCVVISLSDIFSASILLSLTAKYINLVFCLCKSRSNLCNLRRLHIIFSV